MEVYDFQSFCFVLILFYIGFLFTRNGSLFSSLLLCRIIDIACSIAMVLIFQFMTSYQIPNHQFKVKCQENRWDNVACYIGSWYKLSFGNLMIFFCLISLL